MYSKCPKTGNPRPDPAMAALYLKVTAQKLRTVRLIHDIEGKAK